MQAVNPFDQHLEVNKRIPADVRDASRLVTDTMDLAWKAAQAVFEDAATPEIALAIYDRIVSRLDHKADQPSNHSE